MIDVEPILTAIRTHEFVEGCERRGAMFNGDGERGVYSYPLNGKMMFADPLLLQQRLDVLAGGSLNALLEKCQSQEYGIWEPSVQRLAYAACTAFKLGLPFNEETGQGILYDVWVRQLNHFTEWLEKNAGPGNDSPMSLPPA